jgi:hypothetical protein
MFDPAFDRTSVGYALCHIFAWIRGRPLDVFERSEAWTARYDWLDRERQAEGCND